MLTPSHWTTIFQLRFILCGTMNNPADNNTEIALETALENRDAVLSLAQKARSRISLFSRDLDPRVFDNAEFEHCIFNLA